MVVALLVGELAVRGLRDPRDADFLFDWCTWEARARRALTPRLPAGAAPPPGVVPTTQDGYRGVFDASARPAGPLVVIAGAGHAFGQDVPWGRGLGERLQAGLRARGVHATVWNQAVPGSTVLFAERVQLATWEDLRPDVVVLGHGGFNEALYGRLPERWTLHPRRPVLNLLLSSQLLQVLILRSARLTGPPRPKVSLETYAQAMERVIGRLDNAGVRVVLLQQVVVNPDIEGVWRLEEHPPYRRAQAAVARRLALPVVDPLDVFGPPLERWFVEEEYYSAAAHAAVADALLPVVHGALPAP